jgi:hypothetical protein
MGTLFAYIEASRFTEVGPAVFNSWVSPLGLKGTWTARTTFSDSTSSWICRVPSLPDSVLLGQVGPLSVSASERTPYHAIMRSTDLGQSWASVVPSTVFPVIGFDGGQWRTLEIVHLDTAVLALGTYTDDGFTTLYGILRSTDGGLTFAQHTPASLPDQPECFTGFRLSSGTGLITVVAPLLAGSHHRLFRTTDAGVTFTEITMPNPSGTGATIRQIVRTATGRLLMVGFYNRGSGLGFRAYGRYSDDEGLTWTLVDTLIPELPSAQSLEPYAAVALANGWIILSTAMPTPANDPGGLFKPFYRSTDDGLSFSQTGMVYADTPSWFQFSRVFQMTVADDGMPIAAATSVGVSIYAELELPVQLWRGEVGLTNVTWSIVFEDTFYEDNFACLELFVGNIAASGPTAGIVGVDFDCPTTFIAGPCPQVCPSDPVQPAGQVVAPGGGPVTLAGPTGCGAPFVVTSACTPVCP